MNIYSSFSWRVLLLFAPPECHLFCRPGRVDASWKYQAHSSRCLNHLNGKLPGSLGMPPFCLVSIIYVVDLQKVGHSNQVNHPIYFFRLVFSFPRNSFGCNGFPVEINFAGAPLCCSPVLPVSSAVFSISASVTFLAV